MLLPFFAWRIYYMWFQETLEDCEMLRAFEASKMKIIDLSLPDDEDEEANIKQISIGDILVRDSWPHQS